MQPKHANRLPPMSYLRAEIETRGGSSEEFMISLAKYKYGYSQQLALTSE